MTNSIDADVMTTNEKIMVRGRKRKETDPHSLPTCKVIDMVFHLQKFRSDFGVTIDLLVDLLVFEI